MAATKADRKQTASELVCALDRDPAHFTIDAVTALQCSVQAGDGVGCHEVQDALRSSKPLAGLSLRQINRW